MTDREEHELAARAAALRIEWIKDLGAIILNENNLRCGWWNPKEDDGDAFRLSASLGLVVDFSRPSSGMPFQQHHIFLDEHCDNETLSRLAIFRAAVGVGKGMKS